MAPVLRSIQPEDEAFIYSTMLRGVYHGSPWFSQIAKPSFFKNYALVVKGLLTSATVLIACLPADPENILGYMILSHTGDVLHYCYVKEPWRSKGIAKALLGNFTPEAVTHITKAGNAIRKRKGWTFDPFKI